MPNKKKTIKSVINATNAAQSESELVPGTGSIMRSIAHAVVIKDEDIFFLCEFDGRVPLEGGHGFGLYYHDCRFLNGYELKVGGRRPEALVWNANQGFMAMIGLSNADVSTTEGNPLLKHSIEIKWARLVSGEKLALFDEITFQSLITEPIGFSVSVALNAAFEDIFAIRGLYQGQRGKLRSPVWKDDLLSFVYEGADGLNRSLSVYFTPTPISTERATAHFRMELQPKERKQLLISFQVSETPDPLVVCADTYSQFDLCTLESGLRNRCEAGLREESHVRTDSMMLNRIMERSFRDLEMLRGHLNQGAYFAAGVPWFATLFGRDSIITAMQTLAYNPHIAEQTIRLLASFQGKEINEWREEEPGKILHEIRIGEMARLGDIPHTPYYGSIDATPLFLMLIGQHAAWTGSLTLFDELRASIEAALDWIRHYGDRDGDGYVEYRGSTSKGLSNQGWKDSGDAISNDDGSLARPPIALVEVQGYVWQAKMLLADLYRRAGETKRAESLLREAGELRARFNQDFWVEEKGVYALALQAENQPVAVVSSNSGHALWSGIADVDKAHRTAKILLADEMFNGWGIRTFSEKELCYNPLGYHLGTVWPHDNSIIAMGMKRYSLDDYALRVFVGLIEAAVHFEGHRLPELFAGFRRGDYGIPVRYPVACQPQAWAAGAIPYLITALLGLEPEAFEQQLRIVRPVLPDFVNHVEIHNLKLGTTSADLKFVRTSDGIAVEVVESDGPLKIVLEN